MAREIERKRFHLERIIEHISDESTSVENDSFRQPLVINTGPEQLQVGSLLENRDLDDISENMDESKSASDSSTESGSSNEKEDSIEADESTIPMKISPRCDICSLLHFRSYRCLTIFSAPSYLRKAFDDSVQKLRVCRKCLTSKESCVENVAISSLASYSAQIRQMKIPLGMTADRRTKAFDYVVRDLKQLKRDAGENNEVYPFESYKSTSPQRPVQPMRKTLLQRFNVDDPVEKNLFLKELDLYSTDFLKNMRESEEVDNCIEMNDACDLQSNQSTNLSNATEATAPVPRPETKVTEKAVYHVAAKNVPSSNVPEKKIGEMFDARKGMSHDLVVNTKRAWKPNKKYDDLRKVERSSMKKEAKARGPKPGKSCQVKIKVDKSEKSDQPEKVRTCGIHCAVCEKHVQKSYSCCTLQTAPEKFKHLFTPGVHRLKICRKCIPYKKVQVKTESPVIKKKTGKVKQKRGRKPKAGKLATVVKAILSNDVLDEQGLMKDSHGGSVFSSISTEPFASAMQDSTAKESASEANVNCDRNKIMSKMENKIANMDDITTQDRGNPHFPHRSIKREEIPVGVFTS